MATDAWQLIWPTNNDPAPVADILSALIKKIAKITKCPDVIEQYERLDQLRQSAVMATATMPRERGIAARAALQVVLDLAEFGWRFRIRAGTVMAASPKLLTGDDERQRRRLCLLHRHRDQLRSPPVRAFIRDAEQVRFVRDAGTSIYSLMRDGRDLAQRLEALQRRDISDVAEIVDPYLQIVTPGSVCEQTGLELSQIWRYFRHTWANRAESIPGRSMSLLIRDRATRWHSVIGIAALSSAAVKVTARDRFIGWDDEGVVNRIATDPQERYAKWLQSLPGLLLADIYSNDFADEGIYPATKPVIVTDAMVKDLRRRADEEIREHRRDKSEHGRRPNPDKMAEEDWVTEATTPLFRAKRLKELAAVHSAQQVIETELRGDGSLDLVELASTSTGRRAMSALIRRVRARSVGTAIADLTVCGAVPPYNEIRAGKLVAMLSASPEVVGLYHKRYSETVSVIASAMAGRPIVRPSRLVFIGTTSLYGVRPCQYDRASFPACLLGGPAEETIRYRYLGQTEGYGSGQFGTQTVLALGDYEHLKEDGERRVHHRYGEGASPRMRGIRDGLNRLGFSSDVLLRHGHKRALYGVSLITNLSDYLLGLQSEPDYLFDRRRTNGAAAITQFWFDRWVTSCLGRPETAERIRRHTLVRPITHGARVVIPKDADTEFEEEQLLLFGQEANVQDVIHGG